MPRALGAPTADRGAPPARAGWRSPLSITLRFAPVSPRVVDAVAGVFQHLYLPPVMIVALAMAAAGQIWLYGVQHFDFNHALQQAFARPALLVGVLGLSALATLFHEIGHSAALRYGGGRPRRIGMGFYMLMPVFFSDVSDNYRLGRWARLRTDLGGIYFNLLADLVFFALYAATRQSLLLFAVAATNIEILFNLVPFGRFDGYWALADLTGIPDFFALMVLSCAACGSSAGGMVRSSPRSSHGSAACTPSIRSSRCRCWRCSSPSSSYSSRRPCRAWCSRSAGLPE